MLNKHYIQSCLNTTEFQKNLSYNDGIIKLELVNITHVKPINCIGVYNKTKNSICICEINNREYYFYEKMNIGPGLLIFRNEKLIASHYQGVSGIKMTIYPQQSTIEKRKK